VFAWELGAARGGRVDVFGEEQHSLVLVLGTELRVRICVLCLYLSLALAALLECNTILECNTHPHVVGAVLELFVVSLVLDVHMALVLHGT
jgi:hypothetical protein